MRGEPKGSDMGRLDVNLNTQEAPAKTGALGFYGGAEVTIDRTFRFGFSLRELPRLGSLRTFQPVVDYLRVEK